MDYRRSQKLLDPFCFVESLVEAESNLGSKFQVNAPGDLTAHVSFIAIKSVEHFFAVAASERHHIDGGEPQIGAHMHLRHRDHVCFHGWVVDVAARQHGGELVTNQFADAKLALRAARVLSAMMLVAWHDPLHSS